MKYVLIILLIQSFIPSCSPSIYNNILFVVCIINEKKIRFLYKIFRLIKSHHNQNMLWKFVLIIKILCIQSDILVDLNEQFLKTYDRARDRLISTIDPLIICNGDNAIIIHRGQRYEEQIIPKLYHDLKTISHIPFKIYLTIMFDLENLSENNYFELKQYLQDIRLIRNSIQFSEDIQNIQYDIIDLSIEYLRTILKTKLIDQMKLKRFCRQARILFSTNIDLAARLQIDMLHSKIRPWYENHFNDTERRSVKIILMGPKTARHGFIEKTYFYTLLGEKYEGKHIIYAESVDNEQKALEVLGIWLLDAKASRNFFDGDSERLHRDLLGDAAKVYIKRLFKKTKHEL